ncbi:hypothetical protein GLW08_20315 [Pontibacillus yanchengensis]|uniref:Uncharacterized protein n=2 Tax=Pontibacillus yanchengensis TaxID=462910 RepID=A0ACC7VLT4_9BACI|nr:hypothetical protein [Pontibacillus yanchengensis]MYL35450.1 hypothetical protein [Pontibacillus yanchengensis]MYL55650.1 hypothetical protein [Pontibacillus yanchengensis]
MSKSVFMTSDSIMSHALTADNLMIAKVLHDHGTPLDGELWFWSDVHFRENSIFEEALSKVFDDARVQFDEERDAFRIWVKDIQEVQEWCYLRNHFTDKKPSTQIEQDENGLLTLLSFTCEYYLDLELNGRFTEDGIVIECEEDTVIAGVTNYQYIRQLLEFKKEFEKRLLKWRN